MLASGDEDRFLDVVRKQLGKRVFEELRRAIGGNKKQFARTLLQVLAGDARPPVPGGPRANADAPPATAASARGRRRPPLPGQKDFFDD